MAMAVLLAIGLTGLPAFAQDSTDMDRQEFGSGFVVVEGGLWRLLGSARRVVADPGLVYVTTGFSLTRAFDSENDYEPLKVGPKFGFGIGSDRGVASDPKLFFDILMKVRYTFGAVKSWIRPYVDAGPGVVNFHHAAFELEGGAGFDLLFGRASVGTNVQYKELFGAGDLRRGLVFLAGLGYRF